MSFVGVVGVFEAMSSLGLCLDDFVFGVLFVLRVFSMVRSFSVCFAFPSIVSREK